MAKRRDQKKGVFCLETASWDPGIRGTASVEHVLRLLKATERVPFLHFDVGTREELDFYLKKWGGVSFKNSHPVLYLGFHGRPGEICLGERQENSLSLEDIAERLEDKCRGMHRPLRFMQHAQDAGQATERVLAPYGRPGGMRIPVRYRLVEVSCLRGIGARTASAGVVHSSRDVRI